MLNCLNSLLWLWEARALILLRSHLRTGGTVKRQVACLSRVVLIEMVGDKSSTIQEFFSFYFHSFQRKNGGACCFSSWNAALSFKSIIGVCQSQPWPICVRQRYKSLVCGYKQFSKGGRQNNIRISHNLRKMKVKIFSEKRIDINWYQRCFLLSIYSLPN